MDSHWIKPTVTHTNVTTLADAKKITTRSDSRKALGNVTNNKTSGDLKAPGLIAQAQKLMAAKGGRKVSNTKTTASKPEMVKCTYNELPKPMIALKREDSRVCRRSLSKIRSALMKKSSTENITALLDTPTLIQTHSVQLLNQVENIDANDIGNPQLVPEYVNDIYNYLYQVERQFQIRENYMEQHSQITPKMRHILVDWINEVHLQFKLETETYHMAISIIDRYLQATPEVERRKLQLVGVTALFLASKYEELYPPEIHDFVYITSDTYTKQEIIAMELQIFKALQFNLSVPQCIHFLRRFTKAAKSEDSQHSLAKYIMELTTMDYTLSHIRPSEVAAASLFLAIQLIPIDGKEGLAAWTPTLLFYSKYEAVHLMPTVKRMALLIKNAPEAKLQAVYTKYQMAKFNHIAKNPALNNDALDKIINAFC